MRIWENYVERKVEETDEVEEVNPITYEARVQYIESANEFYLSKGGDNLAKVESGMEPFTAKYGDKPSEASGDDVVTPARSDIVAALYDGSWYRASIDIVVASEEDATDSSQLYEISFIDYGNKARVDKDSLRPLSADLQAIPPQSFACKLAFVKAPGIDKDWGEHAGQYLAELIWAKTLTVQDVEKEDSTSVIIHVDSGKSVNEKMIAEGLARFKKPYVPRSARRGKAKQTPFSEVTKQLQAAHAKAASARKNMFSYGDFDSDDDPKGDLF